MMDMGTLFKRTSEKLEGRIHCFSTKAGARIFAVPLELRWPPADHAELQIFCVLTSAAFPIQLSSIDSIYRLPNDLQKSLIENLKQKAQPVQYETVVDCPAAEGMDVRHIGSPPETPVPKKLDHCHLTKEQLIAQNQTLHYLLGIATNTQGAELWRALFAECRSGNIEILRQMGGKIVPHLPGGCEL